MRRYDFELLIMRHGQAQGWVDGPDSERPLTEPGKEAIARAALGFLTLGLEWSEAWSSPYLRTNQTSHLVWSALNNNNVPGPEPKFTEKLVVMNDPSDTVEHILARGHALADARPCLAVFGHQPNLAAVASLLLGDNMNIQIALGQGDLIHMFVPAPSPFDTILEPDKKPPTPRATLLGFYPRHTLEKLGQLHA